MKKIVFSGLVCALVMSHAAGQAPSARINHIAFSVADLRKSTGFYMNIVHLDSVPEPFKDGRHTWLTIGPSCRLHLIQNPGPVIVPSKNTHLCFSVPSVGDFIRVLKQNGIAYEDWQGKPYSITLRADGVKQIYFKDPDGYWIEINDAKD